MALHNFLSLVALGSFSLFAKSPAPVPPGPVAVKGELPLVDSINRPNCGAGHQIPRTRVETYDRVQALRAWFSNPVGDGRSIQAYIIGSADQHQSEYVSSYDKRRGFITGFQGSAGTAVVTFNESALWTDGRYFLEAESVLDCHWRLQREYTPGVPTIAQWLGSVLPSGTRVGASPLLLTSGYWLELSEQLTEYNITLVHVLRDLVDMIWSTTRPKRPNTIINALPREFAGKSWQDKIRDVRSELIRNNADAFIVTSLDEIAWLYNLRGNDVPYNPFFLSYAIVERQKIRLYLYEHEKKLTSRPTDRQTKKNLYEHLNTGRDGQCHGKSECVEVYSYDDLLKDVKEISYRSQNKIWISHRCNYAIYALIPPAKLLQTLSPISAMKAVKNDVERKGMENANIRDSVALIDFIQKLEKEVKDGRRWTEMSAAAELEKVRRRQKYNRGLSFRTISGSGPNGAIIHYTVSNITDRDITTRDVYLLDSGGQYLDGTTDITRTFHFGTPTSYERECYTRVLMGFIDLARRRWPEGTTGSFLDSFARQHLWDVGLVYLHGTGHGIGAYLSVHEGPSALTAHMKKHDVPLMDGMFLSDEPGFYEDGKFGIRLETALMVQEVRTKYRYKNMRFLSFKPVTLVPFETNLIDYSMLNRGHIEYLNYYNRLCSDVIGPELLRLGKYDAIEWLRKRTMHLSGAAKNSSVLFIFVLMLYFVL